MIFILLGAFTIILGGFLSFTGCSLMLHESHNSIIEEREYQKQYRARIKTQKENKKIEEPELGILIKNRFEIMDFS